EDDEFEIGQALEEWPAPDLGALAARRQIAALAVEAGKAEPHRHDRDLARVVENLLANREPAAQPDAGRIGIGAPRGMDPDARRLASDAKARFSRNLEDRPRLMRQGAPISRRIAADAASPQLSDQGVERGD